MFTRSKLITDDIIAYYAGKYYALIECSLYSGFMASAEDGFTLKYLIVFELAGVIWFETDVFI